MRSFVSPYFHADLLTSTHYIDLLSHIYENFKAIPNNTEILDSLFKNAKSFSWILCEKEKDLLKLNGYNIQISSTKNTIPTKHLELFLIIRGIVRFFLPLQKTGLLFNAAFFKERKLLKNSIMTYFYNSRSLSRNAPLL